MGWRCAPRGRGSRRSWIAPWPLATGCNRCTASTNSSWPSGCACARAPWAGRSCSRPSKTALGPTSPWRCSTPGAYGRGTTACRLYRPVGRRRTGPRRSLWQKLGATGRRRAMRLAPRCRPASTLQLRRPSKCWAAQARHASPQCWAVRPQLPRAHRWLAQALGDVLEVTIAPAESFEAFWHQLQACSGLKVASRSPVRWRYGCVLRCKCLSARTSSRTCFGWSCST